MHTGLDQQVLPLSHTIAFPVHSLLICNLCPLLFHLPGLVFTLLEQHTPPFHAYAVMYSLCAILAQAGCVRRATGGSQLRFVGGNSQNFNGAICGYPR